MRGRGIPFFGIHTGKLRRYWDLQNVIDAFKVPLGFLQALRILRKKKPAIVFAKGGYVSFPVVMAARALKIPVWLHESDLTPGLANRWCARAATQLWLSFEESARYFTGCDVQNVHVVGNPIRSEITKGNKRRGYEFSGCTPEKPVVLVMGGSSGAASLNALIFKIIPQLTRHAQVVHVTGTLTAESRALCDVLAQKEKSYHHFDFIGAELPDVYAITDLAVSRAGSGSLFELLSCEIPMVLVPLSKSSSRGDQIENAASFATKGWAITLDQDSLTSERLGDVVTQFIKNEHLRTAMSHAQKSAPLTNAAAEIAKALRDFCNS